MYARRLTKEELIENGITEVTTDGHVFRGQHEEIPRITNGGYFTHDIYDKDENGNRIKIAKKNSAFGYVYKTRSLGLHRLMWAWHHGEVPEGLVVDHINNCHDALEDYDLSNLQLLTPAENLAKDRPNWHVREIVCKLNKPRSFYQDKLEKYMLAYEKAKANKDVDGAHKLRSAVCQTRARLRYYDSHITEALEARRVKEEQEAHKREYHERAQKKKDLKAEVDYARKFYKDLEKAYGKDDDIVNQYKFEWRLAVARLQKFKGEAAQA
jgi:hypothetical protein